MKFLRKCYKLLLKIIFVFLSPLSVINGIRILVCNPKIFANSIVMVGYYNVSFGHQISTTDHVSRLVFPNRVSVIHLHHPKRNKTLTTCWENVDVFTAYGLGFKFPTADEKVLSVLIKLVSIVYPKFVYLDARHLVYKTLSQSPKRLKRGDGVKGGLQDAVVDHTGLKFLYEKEIGRGPRLPEHIKRQVELELTRHYPTFFDRPFVCLHLRGKHGEGFSSDVRNPGDHATYLGAVNYLVGEGFHVLGAGECDHDVFKEIDGYFPLPTVTHQEALNLYSLMYPVLFVGQQSGPLLIPSSCNIPSVITENFPYVVGTLRSRDIVLYKPIYIDGAIVPPKEIFNTYPELAFGAGFSAVKATVGVNSSEDITSAVMQGVEHALRGKAYSVDEMQQIEGFRSVYRPDMPIYTYQNPPALCQS